MENSNQQTGVQPVSYESVSTAKPEVVGEAIVSRSGKAVIVHLDKTVSGNVVLNAEFLMELIAGHVSYVRAVQYGSHQ